MPTSFTFHARYALLTYAQCDGLDPGNIVSHLSSLGAECIVGREAHADGGTHYHAFADFGEKRKFRRADCFDVSDHHPNISPSRGSPGKGYDYAVKDGDIVGGSLTRPGAGAGKRPSDAIFAELADCEDERSFWESVKRVAPKTLLCNFPSLKQYATWRYTPQPTEYRTPSSVHFETESLPELTQWGLDNIGGVEPGMMGRYVCMVSPPLRGPQSDPRGGFPGSAYRPQPSRALRRLTANCTGRSHLCCLERQGWERQCGLDH